MFANLGSFIQTALGIVALASLAGLGLMRSKVVDLRETIGDIRGELGDKDRQRLADLAKIAKLEALLTGQSTDLAALGRVVTGEAHWVAAGQSIDGLGTKIEALATQLGGHHEEAMGHWATDEQTLKKMLAALERMK